MVGRATEKTHSPPPPPPPYTAMQPPAAIASAHKIVVGVDFGTTFTGISWISTDGAHVKVLHDVHCINDW